MPFTSPECDNYVGQTAVCLPQYGWGWSRQDLGSTIGFETVHEAGTFSIRIDGFIFCENRRSGIFGAIMEAEHLFSGLLFEATLRHEGDYNLTNRLCLSNNIEIGPSYAAKNGQAMTRGAPIYHGYVMIALDTNRLEVYRSEQDDAG